jgi:hypothetical protein
MSTVPKVYKLVRQSAPALHYCYRVITGIKPKPAVNTEALPMPTMKLVTAAEADVNWRDGLNAAGIVGLSADYRRSFAELSIKEGDLCCRARDF